MSELEFEILVDTSLLGFCVDFDGTPNDNKSVISMLNDFENGEWRYNKFQNFIWDNIAESCLSASERESLVNHSMLTEASKKLRLTDAGGNGIEGSEIAEIVLYAIMRKHFKALPVVPKIFYKQNNQDNAKGADSVHVVIVGDDDFTVWFGEAKFYNSIANTRLPKVINSVNEMLSTDKLKKENSIITNVGDLEHLIENATLKQRIHDVLNSRQSVDELKVRLNVPILLLHECDHTKAATEMDDEYRAKVVAFQRERASSYFKKQIAKVANVHLYSSIKFHLILFPVPDKSKIVERFLENVEHYKRQ